MYGRIQRKLIQELAEVWGSRRIFEFPGCPLLVEKMVPMAEGASDTWFRGIQLQASRDISFFCVPNPEKMLKLTDAAP